MLDLFINALATLGVMAFLFVIAVTVAVYKLAKSGKIAALSELFGQASCKTNNSNVQNPIGQ